MDNQSQFNRVNQLLSMGAVTQDIADKFHVIRGLRNDCLHYNQGFKQKINTALKTDALTALNSIKYIYAQIVGVVDYKAIDPSKFSKIVNTIAKEAAGAEIGKLGIDEALIRTRNIFASAFGIDISMNNSGTPVISTSIFSIEDIDSEEEPYELSLKDVTSGFHVFVDITESELNCKSQDLI